MKEISDNAIEKNNYFSHNPHHPKQKNFTPKVGKQTTLNYTKILVLQSTFYILTATNFIKGYIKCNEYNSGVPSSQLCQLFIPISNFVIVLFCLLQIQGCAPLQKD